MARQIINYDEEMVGANHPTKSDTLNRALLISHADAGGCRHGTSFPATGLEDRMMFYRTDEDKLYVYDQPDAAWRGLGGGPAALDNATASLSFTADQTNVLVDLSTYVPAGAKRAKLLITDGAANEFSVKAKAEGATNWQDANYGGNVAFSGIFPAVGLLVPVDANRKIRFEAKAAAATFNSGKLIVTGYEL